MVVPGVWIEYPPNQYKNDCSWIKPLTASSFRDTRVFLFHYHLEVDGSSLWDQLLGQGGALIEGLDQSRVMPEVRMSRLQSHLLELLGRKLTFG